MRFSLTVSKMTGRLDRVNRSRHARPLGDSALEITDAADLI